MTSAQLQLMRDSPRAPSLVKTAAISLAWHHQAKAGTTHVAPMSTASITSISA